MTGEGKHSSLAVELNPKRTSRSLPRYISLTKLKLVYEGLLTVYMPIQPVNSSVLLYLGANGVRQKERAQTVLNYFIYIHRVSQNQCYHQTRMVEQIEFHIKISRSQSLAGQAMYRHKKVENYF